MVKITANEVRHATKERCYDYGLIALALSDPAIQRLVVQKCVEGMTYHDFARMTQNCNDEDVIRLMCPTEPDDA